jgi:hypothetical protein
MTYQTIIVTRSLILFDFRPGITRGFLCFGKVVISSEIFCIEEVAEQWGKELRGLFVWQRDGAYSLLLEK